MVERPAGTIARGLSGRVQTLAAAQKAFGADWTTALTGLPVGELDYPKNRPARAPVALIVAAAPPTMA
ncbi:MAG TPA: hypothetical protein VN888_05440 [Mycobacterium sp.]|nr:hypothetical protein [Mycobacterium sp.]